MPLTIDATAGGANANSYISKEDADTYFDSLAGYEWNQAGTTDDLRKQALVTATRQIDQLRFIGRKYGSELEGATDYQNLEWPRRANSSSEFQGQERDTSLPVTRNASGQLIVPKVIREACALQANYLLATTSLIGEVSDRERLIGEGVTSMSVPGLSESYSANTRRASAYISPDVIRLISKYIQRGGTLVRG